MRQKGKDRMRKDEKDYIMTERQKGKAELQNEKRQKEKNNETE
jgi:hypothetical protein